MMLHWLQQTGRQADRPDGRRHDPRRRSVRPRREPAPAHPRSDRREQGQHPGHVLALHPLRRWRRRCADGRQRRVADEAQLHRVPARCRAPFLGQPHAVLRQRAHAPRARPGAVVPRIQLHDPASLRFRRAASAPRLRAADGRLGSVGQHRQRHRSRAPPRHGAALRPHLPAHHHRVGRQDGQDRRRRGLAQRRPRSRPTITGSSGATRRTPMSGAS